MSPSLHCIPIHPPKLMHEAAGDAGFIPGLLGSDFFGFVTTKTELPRRFWVGFRVAGTFGPAGLTSALLEKGSRNSNVGFRRGLSTFRIAYQLSILRQIYPKFTLIFQTTRTTRISNPKALMSTQSCDCSTGSGAVMWFRKTLDKNLTSFA